jgi:hypothetical protein
LPSPFTRQFLQPPEIIAFTLIGMGLALGLGMRGLRAIFPQPFLKESAMCSSRLVKCLGLRLKCSLLALILAFAAASAARAEDELPVEFLPPAGDADYVCVPKLACHVACDLAPKGTGTICRKVCEHVEVCRWQ